MTRLLNRMRRELEESVAARQSEVSVYHGALIQSACRHEARALLTQRWLREAGNSLTVGERVQLMREIGNATDSRDRCLERLGIDKQPDPWATIYTSPSFPEAATDREPQETSGASDNKPPGLGASSDGRERA